MADSALYVTGNVMGVAGQTALRVVALPFALDHAVSNDGDLADLYHD